MGVSLFPEYSYEEAAQRSEGLFFAINVECEARQGGPQHIYKMILCGKV